MKKFNVVLAICGVLLTGCVVAPGPVPVPLPPPPIVPVPVPVPVPH